MKPGSGLSATALVISTKAVNLAEQAFRAVTWLGALKRGEPGRPPTAGEVATAVTEYLVANPPTPGRAPTGAEIQAAVQGYIRAHPPKEGRPGRAPTAKEISESVASYLRARPPKEGKPGRPPSEREIRTAVRAELQRDPPEPGPRGRIGPMPKHQWDGRRIRFEIEPGKWGKWIDLAQEPVIQRVSVGGGIGEARVLELIEAFMPTPNTATPVPFTVTAAGGTSIKSPAAGKRLRLVRISVLNDPDVTDTQIISVLIGSREIARGYAIQQSKEEDGALGEDLIISLPNAGAVSGTAHIEEF